MNEVEKLKQEVNALKDQLEQQKREAENARRKIIDKNNAELRKYRSDMERALREHDENSKREYERLLNEYKKSLNGELDSELAKMDSNYRRLKENTERTEKEIRNKTTELEKAVNDLRNDSAKREQGSSFEAAEHIKETVAVFKNTESKPHNKFAPRRLKVYYDELNDAKSLYEAKLFEASAAVAISASTGLERLGFTIDDAEKEWRSLFDFLVLRTDYLYTKINHELEEWHKFTGGKGKVENQRRIRLTELNFWSYGEYERIVSGMLDCKKIADDINKNGIENYLRSPEGIDIEGLKKHIEDIEKLEREFDMIIPLCHSRYNASCERAALGENIIDFLSDEINLIWLEDKSGFKTVSKEVLESKSFSKYINLCMGDGTVREDIREWLRLVFENAAGNKIYIYIIPVESGINVKNRITIYIDYKGAQQPLYTRDICAHVCEAIGVQFDENNDGTGLVTAMQNIEALKQSKTAVIRSMGTDLETMTKH